MYKVLSFRRAEDWKTRSREWRAHVYADEKKFAYIPANTNTLFPTTTGEVWLCEEIRTISEGVLRSCTTVHLIEKLFKRRFKITFELDEYSRWVGYLTVVSQVLPKTTFNIMFIARRAKEHGLAHGPKTWMCEFSAMRSINMEKSEICCYAKLLTPDPLLHTA